MLTGNVYSQVKIMLKHSLIGVYAILACLCSFVVGVIFLGMGLFDLLEISMPEHMLNVYKPNLTYSETEYKIRYGHIDNAPTYEESKKEQREHRERSYEMNLRMEIKGQKQSLVRSSIYLLICSIAFVIHWKMAIRIENQLRCGPTSDPDRC